MVTSIKNLKNEIDCRLSAGGLSDLACCQLQGAQAVLDNNIVYKVANTAALPSVVLNEGRFVYIDDINEYRYSNGIEWTDDLSTTPVTGFTNEIWIWGNNTCGALGDGTVSTKTSPVREFCSATNWCQVSNGGCSTSAIKSDGTLWTWGRDACGNLGHGRAGSAASVCSPVREFCSATNWCQVSTGCRHVSALKTSGELWAWGCNAGVLGDGTLTQRCSPVREFCSATDWCRVSSASFHTAAIKTTGQLWVWGRNFCGSLGDGTVAVRCSPVRERCSATDWCTVGGGCAHTIGIKTNGELWVWGNNTCGALGDGTVTSRCSPVREFCSATDWCFSIGGRTHTAAIKTTGEIWLWGANSFGQLAVGNATPICSPVREFCSATDWCAISSTLFSVTAIKTTGQLWGWGCNTSNGTVGDGTVTNRCSPVQEFYKFTDWSKLSDGNNGLVMSAIRSTVKGFCEVP